MLQHWLPFFSLGWTNLFYYGIGAYDATEAITCRVRCRIAATRDETIGISLKSSLQNVFQTTSNANQMTVGLNQMISDIRKGKGTAGLLLTDTAMASTLSDAVVQIKAAGVNANAMTREMNTMVRNINNDVNHGSNPINTLLKDSITAKNISLTIENLEKGMEGFNQNMEALKHNFLFRGYFKSLDRQKKKEAKLAEVPAEK
jgi:phospholipid/cholesterol/gamma-HCH transport system substrate-binding protein